ncbi:MAG TPA: HD domain-containing phosphohydrolase [Thermoanaerobaculia bacterium]|nr:HD domain-containing phosphohydrolase [Thermoanaerobaculia bacterium]
MSDVPPEHSPAPRRPRLVWMLVGAMVLVALLPLVVSHFFLIRINRDSLETLEKKYLTRSAVGIATEIQNLLASNNQQLMKIAGSVRVMRKALAAEGDPFLYAAETGWLTDYISPDSDLLALRVLNRAGQGAEAKPAALDQSVVEELSLALEAALKGQPYTGNLQYVSSVNQPAVVVAVPVIDDKQQIIGAVEGVVSLRRISERIRDEGKGDVTAFLVDRNGRVLIHSEPSIDVQHPDFSYLRIVNDFSRAPARLTETYVDSRSGTPVTMLGTVAPVGRPDWGVVVQKPERRAFASVRQMVRATVEWGGIAIVLAIVAATLFSSGIARPIRVLARRSREIAEGNYHQRVELKTHNEIGELAYNFNIMSSAIEQSIEQLKHAAQENHMLFINSVRMLAAAIDAKDPYTRGHSERVARYSMAIGKNLDLPEQELRNLRISALLHDVGKIGIDDRILRKPGALSEDEFEVMKQHPAKGAAIMSGVAQLIDIVPGMKYHHEKWSGGGYPEGLEGEQIPMQARIVSIADTFDAMTTNRPYQKAMELNYVVEKIKSFAGTRFDPRVVDAFAQAVKRGDIQIEEQVRGAA